MTNDHLHTIVLNFQIEGKPVAICHLGQGHIHETYLVKTGKGTPDYVLQHINTNIFRNVAEMMDNISKVTGHLQKKLSTLPGSDPLRETLKVIPSVNGQSWFEDENRHFWRMYIYITDAFVYQKIEKPEMAMEAGKAIGRFQLLLSDLDAPLFDTLPRFHDINFRWEQYNQAKKANLAGRLADVKEETGFVESNFRKMKDYFMLLKSKAAQRVAHHDTKVNNVMFDKNDKAICLIDLDTVMIGYPHFDFGDALRTMACTSLEDEQDLDKVHFNLDIYQAFSDGYLSEARSFLSDEEIALLPFSAPYLTYIIGLRFFTDFINGDIYYRIHYPEHNLVRTRVQFKLAEEMMSELE